MSGWRYGCSLGMTHQLKISRDELANSLTHAVGLALAIAGFAVLLVFASLRGSARHVVSYSIYGMTLASLYAASTAYHSLQI